MRLSSLSQIYYLIVPISCTRHLLVGDLANRNIEGLIHIRGVVSLVGSINGQFLVQRNFIYLLLVLGLGGFWWLISDILVFFTLLAAIFAALYAAFG